MHPFGMSSCFLCDATWDGDVKLSRGQANKFPYFAVSFMARVGDTFNKTEDTLCNVVLYFWGGNDAFDLWFCTRITVN